VACLEVVGPKETTSVKKVVEIFQNPQWRGKEIWEDSLRLQVGNKEEPCDLINYQEGRGHILNCQVGKGEEMSSVESSRQQGVSIDGEEEEERPHPYEGSCETASHINEYDDKLENFIT
jgi:hypothetical protein